VRTLAGALNNLGAIQSSNERRNSSVEGLPKIQIPTTLPV
jgi:hypothetical protein